MFSLKSAPKPAITASLELPTKKGTLRVSSSDTGLVLYQEVDACRFPSNGYVSLTPDEADALVAAILSTRAAQAR